MEYLWNFTVLIKVFQTPTCIFKKPFPSVGYSRFNLIISSRLLVIWSQFNLVYRPKSMKWPF